MPKYVKTKDGIFECSKVIIAEFYGGNTFFYEGRLFTDFKVLAYSDSIGNLCDVAIVNHTICVDFQHGGADFNRAKEILKLFPNETCYGAVFVRGTQNEPIIKSVAIMNNKGELELL